MTTSTPDTAQVRDAWESIASGFDEYVTPDTLRLGERALDRVDVGPGTRFLDVAAGTGALALPAARRGADVVAVDIAPGMVDRLASRAAAEGLTSVEARAMDCHSLGFGDASFDVTASQNGVTMSPDLRSGLSEMVRVTRRGGTVLVVAFGALTRSEFLGVFVGAVGAVVPGFAGLPKDTPPPPFQLADPERFHQVLTDAGLTGTAVDTVVWDMPFGSGTDLWNEVTSSHPIGAGLVAGLDTEQRAAVRDVLDGVLRERAEGPGGAVLHAEVNIGRGTKD
ncbi:class I SAM-dependent methyltransferase [Nocardiopsis aegyptia]|uniref:Ubiquinone/menaquinone biosynthesis C-methylase UbiE n=1 Tax=Nocardiopsis aegyptia TaxID=220378 RepID=A0A7Z0ERF6_9ACTN|nr:methyltransferase domain-containing protein [Nocardiopsis aegyptia]NYJ36893.1 ubiquinone/menaquinone biosynthesis C-methylase UbiE [Nocardiopsis aegyptia]